MSARYKIATAEQRSRYDRCRHDNLQASFVSLEKSGDKKMLQVSPAQRQQILRKPAVCARTGLSPATLYRKLKAGEFPKPVKLGARSVGWRDTDIDAYIAALPQS